MDYDDVICNAANVAGKLLSEIRMIRKSAIREDSIQMLRAEWVVGKHKPRSEFWKYLVKHEKLNSLISEMYPVHAAEFRNKRSKCNNKSYFRKKIKTLICDMVYGSQKIITLKPNISLKVGSLN